MKYNGIDLHLNNCVVTVTDEEDWIALEKRLPNDSTKIVELLALWREEFVGVVRCPIDFSTGTSWSTV